MSDNHAPQLDGDVLGEQVGDDGLPGVAGFPPDQMQGVNDPNLVAPDDVAMREARTRGEARPGDDADRADPNQVGDLLPPDGDDDQRDDVQQMLGAEGDEDRAAPPAEVAAMHIDDTA